MTFEVAEDFRLLWNLFEDRATGEFKRFEDGGDVVVVIRQGDTAMQIRKSYLRRYQAARQLALILQAFSEIHGGEELKPWCERDAGVRC